jgi:ADP-heptose:LPS heptosyltransferase
MLPAPHPVARVTIQGHEASLARRPPAADRIGIVRLGALGDVVRTLPAVSSLRVGYAGAHLTWLIEPAAVGAVQGQPWVDDVLLFPRDLLQQALRARDGASAARLLGRFARTLRHRRFDLVLDFHAIARSALLMRLSGAPRRISYARPHAREGAWLAATDRAPLPTARISRFERNQALVRFLGVDAPPADVPFAVDAAAAARMASAVGMAPVALHAGSSAAAAHKRYPPAAFARVARDLFEARGLRSVAVWGPAPGDRDAARAVVEAAGDAAKLAPETPTVAELAALLAGSRLFVGADSGPLHLASLVGTPVVQILGPTDPVENAPWTGTPSRTLRAPAGDPARLAPEAVTAAARDLLSSSGEARA